MKYISGSLLFMALLLVFAPLHASDKDATYIKSSADGNVVVAVHSYASERDKVRLPKNMRFNIPVGVMIQNRGDEAIGIEELRISEANEHKVWIDRISPYVDRTFGAIMEARAFEHDAADIKAELCNSTGGCKETDRLRVNEIFHAPWIKPGESYYGIIYLETRKGRFTPEKLWSIDDLVLTIPVLRKDLTRAYVMKVSMSGNQELETAAENRMKENAGKDDDPFAKIFVGPSNDRPNNVALYDATKRMEECAVKSIGKIKSKKGRPYGYYARLDIMFDKSGKYLSHTTKNTGLNWLDKAADKVVKGMKDCRIVDRTDAAAGDNDGAHYKYEVIFGDAVAYEIDDSESNSKHTTEAK
ncbi:MAG: hypothetical protein WC551_08505 [Patescibacteria group bacterium]